MSNGDQTFEVDVVTREAERWMTRTGADSFPYTRLVSPATIPSWQTMN